MIGGLFTYSLNRAVNHSAETLHLNPAQTRVIIDHVEPVRKATSVLGFLFTSVFVVYFALFKARTFKGNCTCLVTRVLLMFIYTPFLLYCGAYLDGAIIFCTLLLRFCWTGYYAYRYKTSVFIILNDTTLAFICGKAWYYTNEPHMVLPGGEHFLNFGIHMIPFIGTKDLYVAIRGARDEDLCLVRAVELINGAFFYIFAREPVVGVVNMSFTEIQLYEDVATN